MKELKTFPIYLLTKEEAEIYCRRHSSATKIVPVTFCENGICTTYYTVYVELASNNGWTPAQNIKPEQVRA